MRTRTGVSGVMIHVTMLRRMDTSSAYSMHMRMGVRGMCAPLWPHCVAITCSALNMRWTTAAHYHIGKHASFQQRMDPLCVRCTYGIISRHKCRRPFHNVVERILQAIRCVYFQWFCMVLPNSPYKSYN